jgi:hypothetical protein
VALEALGTLDGGGTIGMRLTQGAGAKHTLLAEAKDAGQAFRLVGLYQNVDSGSASIKVNLDAEGAVEKSGILWARNFAILGDPVVKQVLTKGESENASVGPQERSRLDFDHLRVQFSLGHGQLVLHEAYLNGPVLGATLRGVIDYPRQEVHLGGTYVPLYGINSMFGALPLLGPILVGRSGEGLLGITFGVEGALAKPDVIVNPVSVVAPGIFRQIFELGPEDPHILPQAQSRDRAPLPQSSSSMPSGAGSPLSDSSSPFVLGGDEADTVSGKPLVASDPPYPHISH